jgi:hypothetical protein
MDSRTREQAVLLRRRIITSLHKQDAKESVSKARIRTNYNSASSILLKLYTCLIILVLVSCLGAVYVLQPSLFSVVYRRYISPPKPSLRIRLIGHFPHHLSPREDLSPIGGGFSVLGGGGQYSICTPENAPTRHALHQIRDIQSTLSSPSYQAKDMQWLVQEVPPSGLLLPYLKRQGCITSIEEGWDSTDTKFLLLPRSLQVDWAQWCALTVPPSLAAKMDETATALGMLNFDALRDWEFLQPLSPLLTTVTAETKDKSIKEYRHSNLIFFEEAPRQISISLFVFLAGFDAASASTISKQVVQQWMQPHLLKTTMTNYNKEDASASLSTFLYELLEPQFSVDKDNWVVGYIVVSSSEEPPVLMSTEDTEEVILARHCADGGSEMRSCRFMVVLQEKRKGNRSEATQELRRQLRMLNENALD